VIRAHQIIDQHLSAGILYATGSGITVDFIDQLCSRIQVAQKFDCSAVPDEVLDSDGLYQMGRDIVQKMPTALPADFSYFEFKGECPIGGLCVREPDHVGIYAFCKTPGMDWHVSHCFARFDAESAPIISIGIADEEQIQLGANGVAKCAASFICSVIGLMNAGGAQTVEETIPAKLNVRRADQGRTPIFSHTIITVPGGRGRSTGVSGHKGPPRFHFRRGHLRRLSSGKLVPIRNCMVGDPSRGFVSHDYTVKP
jgi:hypothetical protein